LSTASLVEAVLTLQEERDQWSLAGILPPQTSAVPVAYNVQVAAAEPQSHMSVAESDCHIDASTSAPAAGI